MRDSATIKAYQRRRLATRIIGLLLFLAYTALWVPVAGRLSGWLMEVETSRWIGLFVVAGLFFIGYGLVSLPLVAYRSFRIEHQFGLSTQSLRHWALQTAKSWVVGGVVTTFLVATLYGCLWYGGSAWWLWVWMVWMVLAVGLAKVFPVLILPWFYPTHPLDDDTLRDRLTGLAEGTGLTLEGVYRFALSDETRKANAMLAGLGSTRRVYLSDTLLEGFTPSEIEVVFAHELAHHTHGHIWKGLVMGALASTAVVLAVAWRLDPFAGPGAELWPGAMGELPAALWVATAVQLALQPLGCAVSRHFERQCDTDALRRTANPQAYRELFAKLGDLNLSDPNPPRVVEWLFYDHPAIAKRIALADNYGTPELHV